MRELVSMVWVETRKALRSRMPLWTALGSLFLPLGVAFLIFVAKNPQFAQRLGLVSAKANLVAYAATDWAKYLALFSQVMAAGGFILFVLVISWTFGREFVDGTIKDLLAVPVWRASIVLAKYVVVVAWSLGMTAVILLAGLVTGLLIRLPGGSVDVWLRGFGTAAVTACLTILVVLPFALLASAGRGYLLPIGIAVLTLMATNIAILIGWGEYFPWAVVGLYIEAKTPLAPVSYWIVFVTGLVGMALTYGWWKYADQNR